MLKKSIAVRSDHLQAIIYYAYQQAATSGIDVLDFGDNQNALNSSEQLEELKRLFIEISELTDNHHGEMVIKYK